VLLSVGGKNSTHKSDYRNVEHILKVGSAKAKLHSEAVAIYTLCRQYNIHLEPKWIARVVPICQAHNWGPHTLQDS